MRAPTQQKCVDHWHFRHQSFYYSQVIARNVENLQKYLDIPTGQTIQQFQKTPKTPENVENKGKTF